ncbi:MAG TPA: LPS assembly protein LptD [Candidatus Acidoferrales bacterium]|nr:LPS assembly protein LptD [Candidatus Acidoferrales bacterium]
MRFVVAALAALLLAPLQLCAQKLPFARGEDQDITVDAREITYDQKSNVMTARGDVVVHHGETELRADEVKLNRTTNEADASGDVSVSDPEGVIYADSLHLNLDDETGALTGAAIRSRRLQYSLWGRHVEKGLGQSYQIENGRFTTCNCESGRQDWSISGDRFDVTVDGYGILKGGTFNILDVPVLYIPRAVLPIQRERQSGFLMPRFGASNRRGFQALVPFYWAISKSQDATLGFDVETSARVGLLARYRYALTRQSTGFLEGAYFNEAFRGLETSTSSNGATSTVPRDRWSLSGEQDQYLLGNGYAYSDLNLVSDDRFFRDINTYAFDHTHTVAIRTLPYTATKIGILQSWDHVLLKGQGTYYQDLTTSVESQTLQAAPRLEASGQLPLGLSLLGDMRAQGIDYQRARGVDGFRFDVEPGLTLPLPLQPFGFGSVRVGARETAYSLTDTKQSTVAAGKPTELPSSSNRELVTVAAEAGTTFDRVYPFEHWGLERVKHTIEPEVSYLYIPAVNQDDLPLFDGVDRVNHRNLVTYGFASRLIGRFSQDDGDATAAKQTPIRELARLSVLQSYDLSREIAPLKLGTTVTGEHFSDIDIAGRVNPSRFLSVRFASNYNTSTTDLSSARVGFFVEDPRGRDDDDRMQRLDTRTSAGVSYRFLTNNLLQEVDTNIVLRLTDWAGFLYASRYNVVADRFLDNFVGLRMISSCDCWALDLTVTNRTNPSETEVKAQVTLLGVSSKRDQKRVAVMP